MFQFRGYRFVSVLLALSLALGPLLSQARAHTSVTVSHVEHTVAGDMNAEHGLHASAVGNHEQTACNTHVACGGQCCVTCTHCVTDMTAVSLLLSPHQPVQSSNVPVLNLVNRPSVQYRPPQI